MQISSWWIFGNFGGTCPPDRFTKSDGIRTLVRKLRLCQSGRGRKRTRVECCPRGTGPSSRDDWRTIFRRLFFGKRYKHFTLEVDNRVESPPVNFYGMDCWTFFETALGFARMLNEPESNWAPERLLYYIEMDRYRGGQCTGDYLSRLHYLEDWLYDNDRRGLVDDLTRQLGGRSVPHSAREMSVCLRHYRYLAANQSLLGPLARMEANVSSRPLYEIPKSKIAG